MREADILELVRVVMTGVALMTALTAVAITGTMTASFRRKYRLARRAMDETDAVIEAFGFGAGAEGKAGKRLRGRATPDRSAAPLRAPLSRRLCVAYGFEIGYPMGPNYISFDPRGKTSGSVPFLLDGKTRVSLGSAIDFSPTSAHRMSFRINDVVHQPDTTGYHESYLQEIRESDRRAWNDARLYEWIIPLDEPIEIAVRHDVLQDMPPVLPHDDAYRPADIQLDRVWIHVGERNDAAILDGLRRTRIAASPLGTKGASVAAYAGR